MRKFDPAAAAAVLGEEAPAAAPATSTAVAVAPTPSSPQEFLASVGSYQPPAVVGGGGGSTPYLAFRERSTQDALLSKIVSSLGVVPEGTPVMVAGDKCYRVEGFAFCLLVSPGLEPLQFWTTNGVDFKPTRAWLQSPGFKQLPGTNPDDPEGRVTEQVRCTFLVLPGTGALPDGLAPAFVATAALRNAKVQAVRDLSTAVATAQSAEWAKQNGKLAQVSPSFRVTGSIKVRQKPVLSGKRKGSPYTVANMSCAPISVAQLEAIGAWAAEVGPKQIEDAKRLHAVVRAEIEALAAKTGK